MFVSEIFNAVWCVIVLIGFLHTTFFERAFYLALDSNLGTGLHFAYRAIEKFIAPLMVVQTFNNQWTLKVVKILRKWWSFWVTLLPMLLDEVYCLISIIF